MPNQPHISDDPRQRARRGALLALVVLALLVGVCAGVLYLELGLLRVLPGKNGLDVEQTPNARALTPDAFGAWSREKGEPDAKATPNAKKPSDREKVPPPARPVEIAP